MHSDKDYAKVGRELAKKVIELDKQCDRSKLDEVELEHIKDMVAMARMMFVDPGKYNPLEDHNFLEGYGESK